MDLTVELKNLKDKRLTTLYQNKPFEITQVRNNQIIIKTSTEAHRPIPLKEIANAWNHLEKKKKLSRSEVRDLGYSEFNPAYVVAILVLVHFRVTVLGVVCRAILFLAGAYRVMEH